MDSSPGKEDPTKPFYESVADDLNNKRGLCVYSLEFQTYVNNALKKTADKAPDKKRKKLKKAQNKWDKAHPFPADTITEETEAANASSEPTKPTPSSSQQVIPSAPKPEATTTGKASQKVLSVAEQVYRARCQLFRRKVDAAFGEQAATVLDKIAASTASGGAPAGSSSNKVKRFSVGTSKPTAGGKAKQPATPASNANGEGEGESSEEEEDTMQDVQQNGGSKITEIKGDSSSESE
ncbi:hypothetical protein JCM10908_000935 [Rhodotorula pacifica]|uniref:uncharacterized protein n=1 Tax=Rhodotorula pacifica TaxID=1495444 RepID=UPI00317AEB79